MEKQIKEWENKDKMFVTTRASEYVLGCLQNNSCLTLTGPSGVGKSFIARHTALVLQKQGYKIIPVIKPDDIRDYYQPGKQTVFIVDDICGHFTANQQQIENWQQLLPVIKTIIADKCCKIIVSCRLHVYRDDKFNILEPFKTCECNLMSDKLCLTAEEKYIMASMYIDSSLDNIDKLSQNSEFFPLLCSLLHREKHDDVKEFFKNPFMVYQNELNSLSRHGIDGNRKICSLALIVLFNNQLTDKWFEDEVTVEQRYIIEDICKACMMESTSKSVLRKALLTLDGTFLHNQDGMYRTVHNTLFDFLANYIGQKMIECLIEHGVSDLVHERFMWRKSADDKNININFIIEIPDRYLKLYLKRFIKDWSAGKVRVIFGNNNMTVPLFRKQLLEFLKTLNTSQQVTLANIPDRVLPKENHGSGSTPLIGSCYNGYTDMVQWILHNCVDVGQCRVDGFTGLLFASQEGHTEIVRLLLEKKPNINQCDNTGSSPLYRASMRGKTDIVKLLLENNPDVDLCTDNDCSPLRQASLNGHTEIVKLLLAKNPNVDLCDKKYGCSPLHMACQKQRTGIVKLLLEKNATINLCDNSGCSPLHTASQDGHTEIVTLLLEKNPNINLCRNNGSSPLYLASQNGHTMIVQLLLKRNPDVNLCQMSGCSPLYIASQTGHTNIVKLLLSMNPIIDLCDKNQYSPLYMATEQGHTDIVKLLLKKNANVNLFAINGCSPLSIARQRRHTDIVKLLSEKNSNVDLCENAHF